MGSRTLNSLVPVMYRCTNTPGVSRIIGVKSSTAKRSNNEASLILQIKWTSSTMPLLPCKTRQGKTRQEKERGISDDKRARFRKRGEQEREWEWEDYWKCESESILSCVCLSFSSSSHFLSLCQYLCATFSFHLSLHLSSFLSPSIFISLSLCLLLFHHHFSFLNFPNTLSIQLSNSSKLVLTILESVILAVNSPNTDNNGVTPMPP